MKISLLIKLSVIVITLAVYITWLQVQNILWRGERNEKVWFRGKTEKGEWVFGLLDCHYFRPNEKYYHIHNCETDDTEYEVIPETVGQFTGLTDKNGKKIFEGDILSAITVDANTQQLAVVGFGKFIDENNGDEYLGFYIKFDECKTTITQLEMEEVKDRFEVIGNIHDNPELLGE